MIYVCPYCGNETENPIHIPLCKCYTCKHNRHYFGLVFEKQYGPMCGTGGKPMGFECPNREEHAIRLESISAKEAEEDESI